MSDTIINQQTNYLTDLLTHYNFSRSKYLHLLIAPIEGFI